MTSREPTALPYALRMSLPQAPPYAATTSVNACSHDPGLVIPSARADTACTMLTHPKTSHTYLVTVVPVVVNKLPALVEHLVCRRGGDGVCKQRDRATCKTSHSRLHRQQPQRDSPTRLPASPHDHHTTPLNVIHTALRDDLPAWRDSDCRDGLWSSGPTLLNLPSLGRAVLQPLAMPPPATCELAHSFSSLTMFYKTSTRRRTQCPSTTIHPRAYNTHTRQRKAPDTQHCCGHVNVTVSW